MKRNGIALGISTVLEPMTVLLAVWLAGGWQAGLRSAKLGWYILYLCVFALTVFIARLFFARRDHTNWDVSERKKRIVPLSILTGVFLVNAWVMSRFQLATLSVLSWIWVCWFAGFAVVTLREKISGHMSVLTVAIGLFVRWFGAYAVPLIVLLPLLGWSRVTLRRHTIREVLGGTGYALLILLLTDPLWLP